MTTKGVVKVWNVAKGYGFLKAEDGTEAFVHFSTLPGPGLVEGEEVVFDIKEEGVSSKGNKKKVALNISGAGVLSEQSGTGPFSGTVKLWVSGRSMGIILSNEGEEIHVHSSAFGGGSLAVGKPVTFDVRKEVHIKSKKKIASNVQGEGVVKIGQHQGTIKAWIGGKGYGFAELEDGTEVYIHRSELSDGHCLSGKTVYFDIEIQEHASGRKLAKNVTGPGVRPGSAVVLGKGFKGGNKGGHKGGQKGGKGSKGARKGGKGSKSGKKSKKPDATK